jgi:SH3-like domain-containing protein
MDRQPESRPMRSPLLNALLFAAVVSFASTAAQPGTADPVVEGEEHCVVNIRTDDGLNMRNGPGTQYAIVTVKSHDDCGIIVTAPCAGNWCPVEDGHRAGYVSRHYIAMVSPALYCVSGVAAADALNLRAFPSTSSRILVRLPPHQCGIAFLPYATGGWQKIRVDGWEGWVSRRYLSGQ